MARTKPAAQRRADLLDAAQRLFLSKGLAATTLEDITKGAGVSQGLFYHYFRSKEDLILSMQEQFSARFAQRIEAAAARHEDWTAKLDACVEACFASYRETHDLHEVLFRHSGEERDKAPHARFAEAIRSLLDAGVAGGAYDIADTEATSVLLCAATHAFDPSFFDPHPPGDSRLVDAAQELFRRSAGVQFPGAEQPAAL